MVLENTSITKPVPLDQFFHEQAVAAKLLREKQLKAIEDVLWSPSANMQHGTWLSRFVNTWTQWALYNIILLVMSLLNVHITNFEVQYRQQGDPGPKGLRQSRGGDGLGIGIRQLKILQKGRPHPKIIKNISRDVSRGKVPKSVEGTKLEWGVEVFVSVSSKPIERVSLRNEAAVPAWKSQSDAAQKELYTSLYEDEEEIAPENIFHDDQDDGVGLSASKRGKPPKSKQAAKDPSKQRKGGSQCYLRIDLEPHAALLIVQPGSLACLSRIGKRASTTGAYGKYWRLDKLERTAVGGGDCAVQVRLGSFHPGRHTPSMLGATP
eukprot:jgi/Tetstr1/453081/TSEL_040116.t1